MGSGEEGGIRGRRTDFEFREGVSDMSRGKEGI